MVAEEGIHRWRGLTMFAVSPFPPRRGVLCCVTMGTKDAVKAGERKARDGERCSECVLAVIQLFGSLTYDELARFHYGTLIHPSRATLAVTRFSSEL